MKEAEVTINGVPLTVAQSMTLRVAVEGFAMDLNTQGLGDDEHGRTMKAGYLRAINGIRAALYREGR